MGDEKTMRALMFIVIAVVTSANAYADRCRVVVRKNVVVQDHVPVQFAVAVPVAVVQPGGALYSTSQYSQQHVPSAVAPLADASGSHATADVETAKLFSEFLAWR